MSETKIRSVVNNPCPVCGRTHDDDCGFNNEIVLCHTHINGAEIDGYVYRGPTDDGMWGQFFPVQETKTPRPKQETTYSYPLIDGSGMVQVVRTDDGNGAKTIRQRYRSNGSTRWVYKIPDEAKSQIPLYRVNDPINEGAIAQNQPIFIVEGESCADTLLGLGIPATTSIGGSGKWRKWGHENYLAALEGARVVICPDRDEVGLKHAQSIAADIPTAQWLYAKPDSQFWDNLPKTGGLDVVDWIGDLRAGGLDDTAIREQIYRAIEDAPRGAITKTAKTEDGSIVPAESYKPGFRTSTDQGLQWVNYEQGDDGVYHEKTERVGNHLEAIAYVETPDQRGSSLYLEFIDVRHRRRQITIDRGSIVDGAETFRFLNDLGYQFNLRHKTKLRDYLNRLGANCEQTYVIAPKTGWINGSFITVDRTYGNPELRFGQVEPPTEPRFDLSGTLEGWKTQVAAMAIGNSRMTLGIGCSFAAPFLDLLELESGGVHLAGETSTGKTTVATVAGSVYGHSKKTVTQWRATANGLEAIALEHNDLCLILDEIGQALPIDVAKSAYMLANGQAKIRMQKNRKVDPAKTWRVLFLSTGEIPLVEYLSAAGLPVKGGQEIRMPSVPAVPKNGHGVFENVHGYRNGADFVRALESAIAKNHGTAFDAFMGALIPKLADERFTRTLVCRHAEITNALAQFGEGDEIIGRVAKRFAAIQIALEVAQAAGIIPHLSGDIDWAIAQCFTDWVDSRGGVGSIEVKTACERIRHLLVTNQMSDRIHIVGISSSVVRNLLAHRSGDEFWVPTSVFNAEFVGDCEKKTLIRELQTRGWLKMPTQPYRDTVKVKIGDKTINAYVFIFPNLDNSLGTLGTMGTAVLSKGSSGSQFEIDMGTTGNRDTECQDSITPVPIVPNGSQSMGTSETQSQQGGSHSSQSSQEKIQDLEKNSDSDDQTELIPIDLSEVDLSHLDEGHGDEF